MDQELHQKDVKLTRSEKEQILDKHFQFQLTDAAIKASKNKDYIKAAVMSWSYIEEYYLPTTIKYVAKKLRVSIPSDVTNAPVSVLIKYYLLITHDKKLYSSLEKARKLRNKITHEIFKQKSMEVIDKAYKESMRCNFALLIEIFDRETGKIQFPVLSIWENARNDLRKEQRLKLDNYFSTKGDKPLGKPLPKQP